MAKIAIGVCGIGLGHSTRELQIARWLTANGHEVRILTFGSGYEYFSRTEFKHSLHRVFLPWVQCDTRGVRWPTTLRKNLRGGLQGLALNRRTFDDLQALGFRPDVCVSDYDPATWWLARRVKAPLVTVDHQSSYLGYEFEPLDNGLTPQEERARLALFLPSAAKRIAVSFFTINAPLDKKYRVQTMPPIIRGDVVRLLASGRVADGNFALVYLNSYPKIGSFVDVRRTVEILSTMTGWRFKIYTSDVAETRRVAPNVEIAPTLDGAYVGDLAKASAIICTAGFTLLSEAMALGVPVLAIPLANFNQHLCARIIADLGVGVSVDSERALSEWNVADFLSRLDEFRSTIATTDRLLRSPAEEVLTQICEEIIATVPG